MIHVYKSGGAWVAGGKEYTIKAIDSSEKQKFLDDGWVTSLDKVKVKLKAKPKTKAKAVKDDN